MISGLVTFTVRKEFDNRLDKYLSNRFGGYSRSFFQKLIKAGAVLVNGRVGKASYIVAAGDNISLNIPEPEHPKVVAEDIPLPILYEDEWLMVIDKPAGMVVHPASGHRTGTVANALLGYAKKLSELGDDSRPGIVHRLDKETSGVLLIAKDEFVHAQLGWQFERREVQKEYAALVEGVVALDEDVIDLPLGRDPKNYKFITIRHDGRAATTAYRVVERFQNFTLLALRPRTGRMHQIRVHVQKLGHPVVCDAFYGKRKTLTLRDINPAVTGPKGDQILLARHALHARKLTIFHPMLEEHMAFEAEFPPDIAAVLTALRAASAKPTTKKKSARKNQ